MSNKCIVCDKSDENVSLLVRGNSGKCLCNECVRYYYGMLDSYSLVKKHDVDGGLIKPHEIKSLLDMYVVGNETAKKMFSIVLYNQLLIWNNRVPQNFRKNNVLIMGPTGVGKTFLVETAAKVMNIPFVFCDATTFSEVGYVGDDVSKIVERILLNVDGDVTKAEKSIVFVDEIDKIRRIGETSTSRDVSGEGVQQALLKLMEGTNVVISTKDRYGRIVETKINTKDILFVFGGSFSSIVNYDEAEEKILDFGMIPEFIGRTPIILKMDKLNQEQYVDILTQTDEPLLKCYKTLFGIDGIELIVEDDAIQKIAELASKSIFGARSLFRIIENSFSILRYEAIMLNKERVVVRADDIIG